MPLTERQIYQQAQNKVWNALNDVRDAIDRLEGRTWAGRLEAVRDELKQIDEGLTRDYQAAA